MVKRILWHLLMAKPLLREHFPASVIEELTEATQEIEKVTAGELRICIEGGLDLGELMAGMTPRERAVELFSQLRMWDTEKNNGVLVYILLADRDVEIVADRGVAQLVPAAEWERICAAMTTSFAEGQFHNGILEGLSEIAKLLTQAYPDSPGARNVIDDRPVVII